MADEIETHSVSSTVEQDDTEKSRKSSITIVNPDVTQNIDVDLDDDEAVLARFGKQQQLRRGFRTMSAVGLTCGIMLTWEAVALMLQFGLENGGPAGLTYGFLIAWIGSFFQVLVIAEMASMIPISGGPFNWVAVLAPPWCRNFASYVTGWFSMMAYQVIVANTCYISGAALQGLLVLHNPDYVPQRWQVTLFFLAVLLFGLIVNTYLGRVLPWVESLTLIFYILGFFAVLIPLVYLAPHKSAEEVFTTWQNLGEWPTMGLSFFVGLVSSTTPFMGIDGADHIAEETQSANKVIPRAMLISIVLNGALGFAMLLAILFCMGDIRETAESVTGFPIIDVMVHGTGSIQGGTALMAIQLAILVLSAAAVLASASRMLWALSRENGVPFSKYISRVDKRSHLPLYSIGVSCIINVCLACVNIGSSQAFAAFCSLLLACYNSSFLIAATSMLIKRLTGQDKTLPWGPFRLGRAGTPVTITAIAYSTFTTFFSFWPSTPKVNAEDMNYSSLIFGGALIFSVSYYFIWGRKQYHGPIFEIGTADVLRIEQKTPSTGVSPVRSGFS